MPVKSKQNRLVNTKSPSYYVFYIEIIGETMKGNQLIRYGLLPLILFFSLLPPALADTKIFYRGIRSGAAWINVNGRLAKLTPGMTSKEGIKLLTANKKSITVIVDGNRYNYDKGDKKGTLLENEVVLMHDPVNGSYYSKGSINGKPAIFLVDTGATFIALNKNDAKQLGIKLGDKKIKVSTATKDENAYLVTLKSVKVGDIELKDIAAVVMNHKSSPNIPLLGMSFLDKVEISQTEDQMSLKYKSK
jgi:aspartyl protease family protein